MTDGVLRPVTRRTLTPPEEKVESGVAGVWSSEKWPGVMPVKVAGFTPWDPTTRPELIGKSPDWSWRFGEKPPPPPPPLAPGFSVLRLRLSAPAEKWQLAQAVTPSLPACMSQNSALPSWRAAWRLVT